MGAPECKACRCRNNAVQSLQLPAAHATHLRTSLVEESALRALATMPKRCLAFAAAKEPKKKQGPRRKKKKKKKNTTKKRPLKKRFSIGNGIGIGINPPPPPSFANHTFCPCRLYTRLICTWRSQPFVPFWHSRCPPRQQKCTSQRIDFFGLFAEVSCVLCLSVLRDPACFPPRFLSSTRQPKASQPASHLPPFFA